MAKDLRDLADEDLMQLVRRGQAPAPTPTITAAAGRIAARGQLRGSRIAESSHASSSSAASSTSVPRRLSMRSASSSGGSIGASAALRRASMSKG